MIHNPTVSGEAKTEYVTGTLDTRMAIVYEGENGPVYNSAPTMDSVVKVKKNSILCINGLAVGVVNGNLTQLTTEGTMIIYIASSDFECVGSGPW